MKQCGRCGIAYPDSANYCSQCGRPLESAPRAERARPPGKGLNLFLLTLGGSLLLSWVLIAVLGLPIFILGAILPLFWFGTRR